MTAAATPEPGDADDKITATLIAALALRGHVVHRLPSGAFLVARWTSARELPGLHELRQFARQVGAAR